MKIGVFGLGSQSGRAFFADYLSRGYNTWGYARNSENGNRVLDAIHRLGGIYLERPTNKNNEESRFVPLTQESCVTNDLCYFVQNVDVVIIALPSIYQEESVQALCDAGIWRRRIPIILSPSRSVASPYLWKILGERYPIVCFSTCPYSCKAPKPEVSLIKRRKRTWISSLEGDFNPNHIKLLKELFPQASLSKIPALTSLNNIGAIFHCATYLLNYDEINRKQREGLVFSFYMDGIASRPEVGEVLEAIDQIRLNIAKRLGIKVFGLIGDEREDVWRKLTNGLRALEAEHEDEVEELRKIRKLFMEYLNNCVFSAQHWLDLTYGVERIEGESLSSAIGRTPTYQKNSVPQLRYLTEDIPTGLVPFEALAKMLDVECDIVTEMIDKYNNIMGCEIRDKGRNLKEFTTEYLIDYLQGK
ncbi:MAG: NAD/NADP octopine/nopaline dehydrogenase family protein [Alistipes sp.]|nr:NAD/NADP octopine/nopaline dehydrogenase family protein [Alistipes sp.]